MLLFLEYLSDHDKRSNYEIRLSCEAKLQNSLQKGQNPIDIIILFDGYQH